MPGSLLLSLRGAPTCRRGGPRGSDRQAGRSGPSGLQRGRASFPAKLEGGGSEDARSAPQPGPRAQSRAEGLRSPRSPRRLGGRSPRAAPAGSRSPRGLRARRELFCSARRPGHSGAYCRPGPAASALEPFFPPESWPGPGSPTEPESRGPVPAARRPGKLGSLGADGEDKQAPAPGPAGRRGAAGAGTPEGRSGTGWWRRRRLGTLPAPAYLRWPGPKEDQVSEGGRARSAAAVAATGPRVLRSVSPAVGGSRARWRLSRLQLCEPPLSYHRRRGCPISAAGTGARDVTLRAPPAQSPPPVRATRPPAAQTRAGPAAGARSSRARTRGARTPSAPGRSLHPRGEGVRFRPRLKRTRLS